MMFSSYYMSIIGLIRVDASDKGITKISLACEILDREENDYSRLGVKELEEYFMDHRTFFDLPLDLDGTPFQELVWKTVKDVPYGSVRTYDEIVKSINVGGEQAIKTALSNNPVPIIIPCHRIIGADGKSGDYVLGEDIKQILLKFENCVIIK